jgi:outer membrane protein TolC
MARGWLLRAWVTAAALVTLSTGPVSAQTPALPEVVNFEDAVQRAIAANPTVERAATTVRNAEALLAQARAAVRPTVDGTISTTVIDNERGFDGNVVQPRTQTLFAGSAATPVLAMAQWAARAQAEQRIGVAELDVADVRRQVGVAAAEAYLAVIGAKRQLDVNERARDNAQAQLDYARARREGGVGSRLNELRAAQELAVVQELVERARLSVALGQEALGLITAADRPLDAAGEPALETPAVSGESWLRDRTDIKLFDARIDLAGRVVADSWRDWVPTVRASFDPQFITPAGLFQPSGTWRAVVSAAIPIFDGGQRRALRAGREVELSAARVDLKDAELRAKSGERAARVSIDAEARSLERAREAAEPAAEV